MGDVSDADTWARVLREVLDAERKVVDEEIISYCAAAATEDETASESSEALFDVLGEMLQGYEAAADEDEALAICAALLKGVHLAGITTDTEEPGNTLLAAPVKPAEDGSWESVASQANSGGAPEPKNTLLVPRGEEGDTAGVNTPYQASVDELAGEPDKEVLVNIFNLLAAKHCRFLDRLQMSAVFRAFDDKGSQKHKLMEMPKGEWDGLCRVYDQVYGIPLTVLAEVYKNHLLKTSTADRALEFLRREGMRSCQTDAVGM